MNGKSLHGASKESKYKSMNNQIQELRATAKLAEDERDTERSERRKLAAWLRLHYPSVFREYFLTGVILVFLLCATMSLTSFSCGSA